MLSRHHYGLNYKEERSREERIASELRTWTEKRLENEYEEARKLWGLECVKLTESKWQLKGLASERSTR